MHMAYYAMTQLGSITPPCSVVLCVDYAKNATMVDWTISHGYELTTTSTSIHHNPTPRSSFIHSTNLAGHKGQTFWRRVFSHNLTVLISSAP